MLRSLRDPLPAVRERLEVDGMTFVIVGVVPKYESKKWTQEGIFIAL